MIELVEIRNTNLQVIGIIDTAQSIIWHSSYYGVGDFEIYVTASADNLTLLSVGNYVTRLNNSEVGIIEAISIDYDAQNGRMIVATGRFAKSILDRRQIYSLSGHSNTATILSGLVETAIRQVVTNNIISCAFDLRRNVDILQLGALAGLTETIVDDAGNATTKQVSYANLYEYTEEVLKEYGLSATIKLDDTYYKLKYTIFKGEDRSTDNTDDNEPVIFSQEFDNLTGSSYQVDTSQEKNAALIGGVGEDIDRFYSVVANNTDTGLARRETWVDARSIAKKYKDEQEVEQEYTDAEYKAMLDAEAKQALAKLQKIETFTGTIDITQGLYILGDEFALGDIVTIQDNGIGKYINARILETTETQDENGYTVEAVYG